MEQHIKKCKAIDCDNYFYVEKKPGRTKEYCSSRCKDREKARLYRKLRKNKNLCPQCGGQMDSNKSYCSKCKMYFAERYRMRKMKKMNSLVK